MSKATDKIKALEASLKAAKAERSKEDDASSTIRKMIGERMVKTLTSEAKRRKVDPATLGSFIVTHDGFTARGKRGGSGGPKSPSPFIAAKVVDLEVTTGKGKTRKTVKLGESKMGNLLMWIAVNVHNKTGITKPRDVYGAASPFVVAALPAFAQAMNDAKATAITADGKRIAVTELIAA